MKLKCEICEQDSSVLLSCSRCQRRICSSCDSALPDDEDFYIICSDCVLLCTKAVGIGHNLRKSTEEA